MVKKQILTLEEILNSVWYRVLRVLAVLILLITFIFSLFAVVYNHSSVFLTCSFNGYSFKVQDWDDVTAFYKFNLNDNYKIQNYVRACGGSGEKINFSVISKIDFKDIFFNFFFPNLISVGLIILVRTITIYIASSKIVVFKIKH